MNFNTLWIEHTDRIYVVRETTDTEIIEFSFYKFADADTLRLDLKIQGDGTHTMSVRLHVDTLTSSYANTSQATWQDGNTTLDISSLSTGRHFCKVEGKITAGGTGKAYGICVVMHQS